MSQYSFSRRTATYIKSRSNTMPENHHNRNLCLQTKLIRPPLFPIIDQKILKFVQVARSAKMLVTQMLLQQKALMVRDAMLKNSTNQDEKRRLQHFRASKRWVCNFIKRLALRSSLLSKAGSASALKVWQIWVSCVRSSEIRTLIAHPMSMNENFSSNYYLGALI